MVNNKRFGLRNISLFGIINTLILTCLAIITVYPVVYITAVSLSATSEVVQGNITLFPKGFNLDAYAQVLNDDRVPRAYLNTIFIPRSVRSLTCCLRQ